MSVFKTPKSNFEVNNIKGQFPAKSELCKTQVIGNFICPNSLVSGTKPYIVTENNSKKDCKNNFEHAIKKTPVHELNKIGNNVATFSVTNLQSRENKKKVQNLQDNFLTPSKLCTDLGFDKLFFSGSVTKPSRVIKEGNNFGKDSENTIRTVTPARRVKKIQKNIEESTTNEIKTVTPAGRVIKKEIIRSVTPARRVLKVLPKTNFVTKDTSTKNILPPKMSSNKPTMSRANVAMLSQSEKKPTRKSGKVSSTGLKETKHIPKSHLKNTIQVKVNLTSAHVKDVKETAENKENAMKTPPTTHKVYVRPHTTRVISKTFFSGSTNDSELQERDVLNKLRKVLTFGKNDDEEEEEDDGEVSYSPMINKTTKKCGDDGNDDKTERSVENNEEEKDDDTKKPVDSVDDDVIEPVDSVDDVRDDGGHDEVQNSDNSF